MQSDIPSAAEIKAELDGLGYAQVQELSRLSQVPFTTLWKVRTGETSNPGLETVRKFMPFIPQAKYAPAHAALAGD